MQLSDATARLVRPAGGMEPTIRDQYDTYVADLIRPLGEVDDPFALLLGIPFDTTTLSHRGSQQGPRAVRDALASSMTYDANIDVDLSTARPVGDVGDIDVLPTKVEETWERITTVTAELACQNVPLVVVGGDHGGTFPVLRGLVEARPGRLGLISIDAHLDVRISYHDELASGVPIRFALERLDGQLRGTNVTEIGIGGWHNTRMYHDYLREQGGRVITARELHRGDLDALIDEAIERASDGTDAIWLTVDIDGIDGAHVAGTGAPAVGGLTAYQALEIVWRVGRVPGVAGMDVMEVSPAWDPAGLTPHVASALVLTFLAGRHAVRQASEAGGM